MLGFAENLDQLAELKQNGFSFSLYMTDSAEALLDKDRIVKTLEPDEIIEGRGTEPPETVAAGFENVIVPAMTVNTASKIASCMIEAPKDHPFVQIELMMPILPVVRVDNVDEAIDFAVEVEHGNRHTAMIHSKNVDALTKMAKLIQTTIFVKNGPSYAGIGVGGEGYTTFTIAGPTGEGLTSARSFARMRRCVLVGGLSVR